MFNNTIFFKFSKPCTIRQTFNLNLLLLLCLHGFKILKKPSIQLLNIKLLHIIILSMIQSFTYLLILNIDCLVALIFVILPCNPSISSDESLSAWRWGVVIKLYYFEDVILMFDDLWSLFVWCSMICLMIVISSCTALKMWFWCLMIYDRYLCNHTVILWRCDFDVWWSV